MTPAEMVSSLGIIAVLIMFSAQRINSNPWADYTATYRAILLFIFGLCLQTVIAAMRAAGWH